MFVKYVRDEVCQGNHRRADSMVKGFKARGSKFFRTHPDMSSDDSNAEEVFVLEKDDGESVSECKSSIDVTSKKQLQGDTQEDDMRKMLASGKEGGGRGEPLPKAKAKAEAKAEADSDETDAKKQKEAEEVKKQQKKGRGGGTKDGTPNREEQGVFARVPEIAC